jgi:hypothetical protein
MAPNEQWQDVRAARQQGIRRLEMLPQLSLPNEGAGIEKRVFEAASLPKRDVEEGVTGIGPLGLVLTSERRVVGVGRGDDQHVGTG